MNDGRFSTDFRPSCEVHSSIRFHNGLYDSNQYRQFMIDNSEKMMNANRQYWTMVNGCNSCQFVHPDPNGNAKFFEYYTKMLYGNKEYDMPNGKPYVYTYKN
jgi:hypothetical protein